MKKILVGTPLKIEFTMLTEYFKKQGYSAYVWDCCKTSAMWFPRLGTLVIEAGHGKAQFALISQYVIDMFGPFDFFLCAGAAGALFSGIRPGDVILASSTVEHDYKSNFRSKKLPKYNGCREIISKMHTLLPADLTFQLMDGPVASGDEDITDASRAHELLQETNCMAVAWEGAGAGRVSEFNNIPFVEIRAITDFADSSDVSVLRMNMKTAVQNIGRIIIPWLLLLNQKNLLLTVKA